MSLKKSVVTAGLFVLALSLLRPTRARAEFERWPTPFPDEPRWGDYDEDRTWHDADWWWQNRASWTRVHHPEWWGDFDRERAWHPAWWWVQHGRRVRPRHPDWWGAYYQDTWYPAEW